MASMQGPLLKWTNMMKGYQHRWFVLDDVNGLLSYYTSQEKLVKGDRRGCIRLRNAVVGIEDHDDTIFSITADGKVFHCKAHTNAERDKWVNCLEDITIRRNLRRPKRNWQTTAPTEEQFNKKLAETDAYLQILISQLKKIDDKINNSSSDIEKEKLNKLKEQSVYLLDSIKHTIVLLQISKNIKFPMNGMVVNDNSTRNSHSSVNSSIVNRDVNNLKFDSNVETCSSKNASNTSLSESFSNISLGTKLSDNEIREQFSIDVNSIPNETIFNQSHVPDVSYTSSDDEDCFFDANDESNLNSVEYCKSITDKMNEQNSPVAEPQKQNLVIKENSPANEIDYDKVYDDGEEDQLDPLEKHGSVIAHLISQVRIGMDLSKIALPTFILERRSLLEMYADFFAHADVFASIPDYPTPEERMFQALKWYLTAFHAGRKSSIAKKPYNPVLGEVFRCHWNLSQNQSAPECNEGPVPWAKAGDLTFIAEQVSHHPPVSAFYAESVDKRIMCTAQIYTKSKFLGLSVGVNNIGMGSIYLLDHGEEYTATFPSAYGRSILTEPWFELGGTVDLSCVQTGYSAKVEFITKPFYGGKKHRICCEVFTPPPTKKLMVTITGEWNGEMEAKWANTGKVEPFVNTKTMNIVKKQVRPIKQQDEFESRNIWKKVTVALKQKNLDEATNAKCEIEERQRKLVKLREETGTRYEQRAFHAAGDKWLYNSPLISRKK